MPFGIRRGSTSFGAQRSFTVCWLRIKAGEGRVPSFKPMFSGFRLCNKFFVGWPKAKTAVGKDSCGSLFELVPETKGNPAWPPFLIMTSGGERLHHGECLLDSMRNNKRTSKPRRASGPRCSRAKPPPNTWGVRPRQVVSNLFIHNGFIFS